MGFVGQLRVQATLRSLTRHSLLQLSGVLHTFVKFYKFIIKCKVDAHVRFRTVWFMHLVAVPSLKPPDVEPVQSYSLRSLSACPDLARLNGEINLVIDHTIFI